MSTFIRPVFSILGVAWGLSFVTVGCKSEAGDTVYTGADNDIAQVVDGTDSTDGCEPQCTPGSCADDGCGQPCPCGSGELCAEGTETCEPACTPQCTGKECGDDGCGGQCGICPAAAAHCATDGKCQTCLPDCEGRVCGDDGCGGSCGTCATGVCKAETGTCEAESCEPDCAGKDCGPDNCGGFCGGCKSDETCEEGICTACVPDCTDAVCGDDGCGGTCGTCPFGTCDGGQCSCTPACAGKKCGEDGCGGSCGTCTYGTCNASGQCDCTPDCLGLSCGDDGCGGSCGTCGAGPCEGGICTLCVNNCAGKGCGSDGCGGTCGTCPVGTCGGTGESGICGVCPAGDDCALEGNTDPCVTGTTDCTSGTPKCVAKNTPPGTACEGGVCNSGVCLECVTGEECDLDGCDAGTMDCGTGVAQCVYSGNKPNGTVCATGSYCYEGSCDACTAGQSCDIGEECKTGTTKCVGGETACTGATKNKPTGTPCAGGVCKAGGCVACDVGAVCHSELNYCEVGVIDCASGSAVCASLQSAADGTDCGDGNACSGGVCSACQAGSACDSGDPCNPGVLVCSGGSPSCQGSGNYLQNGETCGEGMVCYSGACTACTGGSECIPTDPCHTGTVSCANGTPECLDSGQPASNGTECSGGVCNAGLCVPCAAGSPCFLADAPCLNAAYACDTGAPVCKSTGVPVTNGTVCGADQVCSGGVCKACVEGKVCSVPGKPCRVGLTTCSSGTEACADTGAYLPDGSACGANQVCKAGACAACTAGGSCDPGNGCGVGKFECSSGSPVCAVTGAIAGSVGGACAFDTGTCDSQGYCACAPGEFYYEGLCASCPDFNSTNMYVDADPTEGTDNVCCGRSSTKGQLGGPCRTLTQAIKNLPGLSYTVNVVGDALGNLSSAERYPIQLQKAVALNLSGTCVPGVPNTNIFEAATDDTTIAINYGTLGSTCQGGGGGVKSVVKVAPSAGAGNPTVNLSSGTLRKSTTGVEVRGGNVSMYAMTFQDCKTAVQVDGGIVAQTYGIVEGQTDFGVDCRSVSDAQAASKYTGYGVSFAGVKQRALWAGQSCEMVVQGSVIGTSLGVACDTVKKGTGVYVDGNATADLSSNQIRCFNYNGVSLHQDPSNLQAEPQVVLSGNIIRDNGCAGVFAEWGKVTAGWGNQIVKNHYGIHQKGSTATNGGQITLIGQDPNGTTSRNVIACNSKDTPGACCTKAVCPNGYDVLNNSATTVVASYNMWQESPVGFANCNASLQSCACAGIAGCSSPPADGVPVVNQSPGVGVTKVTTSNNALTETDYCQ